MNRTQGKASSGTGADPRLAVLVVLLAGLFFLVGRGSMDGYAVFLLPLGDALGIGRTGLSVVYAVTFMVWGFSGPVVGWLFDRFGAATVYAIGILCIAGGEAIAANAQGLLLLLLGVGVGVGFGVSCMGNIVAAGLLYRWFTSRLNTALAVVHAAALAGILFWAPLNQYLIDLVGWRDGFWVIAGIISCFLPLVTLVWLAGLERREVTARVTEKVDAIAAGASTGPSLKDALRDPAFWGMGWVFTVTGIGMHSITLQIPAFLVEVGYSPQVAARAFGLCGFLAPAGMLVFGWLGDKIGRRRAVLISYGFSVVGALSATLLSLHQTGWFLIAFVFFYGASFGSRAPAISTLSAELFAGRHFGRIYGSMTIFMGLGGALGASSGGFWRDVTGSYEFGLAVATVMLAAGALPFLVVRKMVRY